MKIHSYVIDHDLGFAPNPFYGVCTLAACKPRIRGHAKIGDYVIGTGSKRKNINGRLERCPINLHRILRRRSSWRILLE